MNQSDDNLALLDTLLSDETFRAWVRQGGLRQPDAYWSRRWHQFPAQRAIMQQASTILLATHLPDEGISAEQTERLVQQTLRQIRPQPRFQPLRRNRKIIAGAVVAFALVLVAGLVWWGQPSPDPITQNGLSSASVAALRQTTNTTNTTDKPQLLTLADGSTVRLQPNARLTYPVLFGPVNREVTLVGDAFFEITKDADHPFMVLANGMVTKVLGTSFRIQANASDPTVTVEVKTGRVAVFSQTDLEKARKSPGLSNQSLLVTPNQQVVFERSSRLMNRQLVANPVLLNIPEQNRDFDFVDAPVSRVFDTLETAYGVDIVYDADVLKNCSLTAPLGNEPLFDKLSIICRAIGGRYEVVGAQLVVQSEGCTD